MHNRITSNATEGIKILPRTFNKAIENNQAAIESMFKQFIPENEKIETVQYLGLKGLWNFGTHSFVCLTNYRIADISVGNFGEIIYQDGYLEFITSSSIFQPSKLALYILVVTWFFIGFLVSFTVGVILYSWLGNVTSFIASIIIFFIIIILIPYIVKSHYRRVKCGIVFYIKGGLSVYIFSDRKFMKRAHFVCRKVTSFREDRVKKREGD